MFEQLKKIKLVFFLFPLTLLGQENLAELLEKYNEGTIPYISIEKLKTDFDNILLLDAREIEEYKVSHIKDAFYIGHQKFDIMDVYKHLADKHTKIVVYCSLGIRSEEIAEKIAHEGFINVYNLYGGIFEWKNLGNEIVTKNNKPTSKIHAYSQEWGTWLKAGEKVF